jgi:adenosylhomocysteinase
MHSVDTMELDEIKGTPASSSEMSAVETPKKAMSNDDLKVTEFFNKVLTSFKINESLQNIAFITVNHVVPTLPYFLEALAKVGRIAAVIPKSSYRDGDISDEINKKYAVRNLAKEELSQPGKALQFVKENIKENEKFIIIDIGGYWSPCFADLYADQWVKDRLLGIVEDTENGHQKYLKAIPLTPSRIISVARSFLKETEDYNVGKSIVEAADTILRRGSHQIMERLVAGVIGFGKIGASIAIHLRQKGIKEILVCDINPSLTMFASSRGFKTTTKKQLMDNADIVFSATGNKALNKDDFCNLKENVYIASVTSASDELDMPSLEAVKITESENRHINTFKINNGKTINLLYRGNAVNFVDGAVNGPFIYSVQAELIVSSLILIRQSIQPSDCLFELSAIDMKQIATIWNQVFDGILSEGIALPTLIPSVEPHKEVKLKYITTEAEFLADHSSPLFNLQSPCRLFIGRNNIKQQIKDVFENAISVVTPVRYMVLAGLSGSGKSELAIKYAWENREKYTGGCLFIEAENKDVLINSFIKIAQLLNIEEEDPHARTQLIYKALRRRGRTLIIFDDVPDNTFLQGHLPSKQDGYSCANFSIIITSLNQVSWNAYQVILIDPDMPELQKDAVEYIEINTQCNRECAQKLAQELQYLPLALSQAVAYIKLHCSTERYLALLQEQTRRPTLLSQPSLESKNNINKQTVMRTWSISLDALSKLNPNPVVVLQCMAFIYPDQIQHALFNPMSEELNTSLLDILTAIRKYSLIYRVDDDTIKIHRLLQEVIRSSMQPDEINSLSSQLINLLKNYGRYQKTNLTLIQTALQHYQTLLIYNAKINKSPIASLAELFYHIGLYYQNSVYEQNKAIAYFENALTKPNDNNLLHIKIKKQLAKAYSFIGNLDKAQQIYQAIEAKIQAIDDIELMIDIRLDQYFLLDKQKKLAEAKQLLQATLAEKSCTLTQTARAHYYLACTYRSEAYMKKSLITAKNNQLTKLEPWKTKQINSLNNEISVLNEEIPVYLKHATDHCLAAIEYNKQSKSFIEVLRVSLAAIDLIVESGTKTKLLIAIKLIFNIYDEVLQHESLSRENFNNDYYKAAIALAKLYANHSAFFTAAQVNQAKEILKAEKLAIAQDFGGESDNYKKIVKITATRQQSILSFLPASAPKTPDDTTATHADKKSRNG